MVDRGRERLHQYRLRPRRDHDVLSDLDERLVLKRIERVFLLL
jgi:hypothetical protein